MVISLFRSNQLSVSLLLVVYALALHIPAYWGTGFVQAEADYAAGPLGQWMNLYRETANWWAVLLPVLVVWVTALAINALATRDQLGTRPTQLPGLFYVLVASYVGVFFAAHSMQLANLALVAALFPYLGLYKHHRRVALLSWAGLWLGTAFLCNAWHIVFLPAFLVGMPLLTRMDLRTVLQLLAGFVAPTLLYVMASYLLYGPAMPVVDWWQAIGLPRQGIEAEPWTLIGLLVLLLCILWIVAGQPRLLAFVRTEARYRLRALAWILLFAGFSLLLQPVVYAASAQIVTVPLGMMLGAQFTSLDERRAESWHLLLLAVFAALQLWPYYLQYS